MANYAIIRCEKIKGVGGMSATLRHCTRERETPNANPARSNLNTLESSVSTVRDGGISDRVMGVLREKVDQVSKEGRKVRGDSVLGIEYLVTYSPEAKVDHAAYFKKAAEWITKYHGGDDRVLLKAVHMDESTPHLHMVVMPIVKKEKGLTFCAKDFMDGGKKLAMLQTNFAKEVGKPFGLERGVEGSIARHEAVKRFYGTFDRDVVPNLNIEQPGRLESRSKYVDRVKDSVHRQYSVLSNRSGEAVEARRVAEKERDQAVKERDQAIADAKRFAIKATQLEEIKTRLIGSLENMTKERDEHKKWRKDIAQFVAFGPMEELLETRAKWAKEITQERGRGRGD